MERRKYDEFNYVPPNKITQLPFLRALYDFTTIELQKYAFCSNCKFTKPRCSLFLVLSAKSLYCQLPYLQLHRRPLEQENISCNKDASAEWRKSQNLLECAAVVLWKLAWHCHQIINSYVSSFKKLVAQKLNSLSSPATTPIKKIFPVGKFLPQLGTLVRNGWYFHNK